VAALRACVVVRVPAPMAICASPLILSGLFSDSGSDGESMKARIMDGREVVSLYSVFPRYSARASVCRYRSS